MRKNCNLELRLTPPTPFHLRQENPSDNTNMVGGDLEKNQSQQLTIFYDGKVSVSDVTEVQARTILKLASEEMADDKCRRTPGSTTSSEASPSSPLIAGGISMKRSLQRFLQKRKHRIQAANCPYNH